MIFPRGGERLEERLGGLRAGDGVAAIDDEERHSAGAEGAGLAAVLGHLLRVAPGDQGLSRGDLRATVDQLHRLMIGREPDLTFLIDIDPDLGLARARGRKGHEERFEDMGIDLQRRIRAGFLALAGEHRLRFRVIDGARAPEVIAAEIAAMARSALGPPDYD